MKLLLFKVLLKRRARDEGFTLPMVIALGLVMLLLGTVNIVKSSEENISAISQNSSSDALAIAEVGITKYRELLNQNRILTVYNQDQWTANGNVSAQTCNNIATTPTGWEDGGAASAPNNTGKWWEIKENIDENAGNDLIGEYRLVSYEYDIDGNTGDANNDGILDDIDDNSVFSITSDADTDDDPPTPASGVTANSITDENDSNDDGQSDAVGILTVQGKSLDASVAQIEVEIPLRINDLENFAPVLWVGSGAIATPGTLNIPNADDNIVLKSSGTGCSTPAAIAGNSNVISDSRNLPAIIPDPITIATDKKNNIGSIDTTYPDPTDPSITDRRILLPRPITPSDNKNDQDQFLYEVTTIDVVANSTPGVKNDLVTDGTAKVTLYVTNNINITGTPDIPGTPGTPPIDKTLTVGNSNAANPNNSYANFNNGSTTNTSVSSQNLEIYVAGNQTININPNGGTINIEAFIHAPEATLNITGSGTVNINGAVWVNNFNNTGSATVNIRSDKTSTTTASEASYKFYTTSATMTPRPLTSTPTDWVREEVQ
jgi:hypothetical protein